MEELCECPICGNTECAHAFYLDGPAFAEEYFKCPICKYYYEFVYGEWCIQMPKFNLFHYLKWKRNTYKLFKLYSNSNVYRGVLFDRKGNVVDYSNPIRLEGDFNV